MYSILNFEKIEKNKQWVPSDKMEAHRCNLLKGVYISHIFFKFKYYFLDFNKLQNTKYEYWENTTKASQWCFLQSHFPTPPRRIKDFYNHVHIVYPSFVCGGLHDIP